jgi:hypothetical protein
LNSQFTPICDAEQQESWDKEFVNVALHQDYEVTSRLSEDTISEIQDATTVAHSRALKSEIGK